MYATMKHNPKVKAVKPCQARKMDDQIILSHCPESAEGSGDVDSLLNHVDEETMHKLQMQVLQDEEFADDMRALLLARFRAKHRCRSNENNDSSESPSESSDNEKDPEPSYPGEEISAEVERLKALGYELQPHEKLLSKSEFKLIESHREPNLRFIFTPSLLP